MEEGSLDIHTEEIASYLRARHIFWSHRQLLLYFLLQPHFYLLPLTRGNLIFVVYSLERDTSRRGRGWEEGQEEGDLGKRKVYEGYLTDVLFFMNETIRGTCMHSSLWDCFWWKGMTCDVDYPTFHGLSDGAECDALLYIPWKHEENMLGAKGGVGGRKGRARRSCS